MPVSRSLTRRTLIAAGGAALAAPAIVRPAAAQAVTLKFHHFLPAVSNVHSKLLVPWVAKVAKESQGQLKIEIYPSMQLGGAPPQLYDQAKDGVADITWTLPGSTPGRFPSAEVFELPFVANRLGIVNARASQDFADSFLGNETREVKLLSFWSHDHGLVHSRRQVKTLEDMKGLKIRFPSRLIGEALKALGASPVGLPVPQVPESISQGVIDAAALPWEIVPAVKMHELVKFHTDIPGSPTFYTASFFLLMNKAKYAGLPAELRKVIDDTMGLVFATDAGKVWDEAGATVKEMVAKRGNTIYTLPDDEKARWVKATEPVIDGWIKTMKDKGLDGAKLLEGARAALAKHAKA